MFSWQQLHRHNYFSWIAVTSTKICKIRVYYCYCFSFTLLLCVSKQNKLFECWICNKSLKLFMCAMLFNWKTNLAHPNWKSWNKWHLSKHTHIYTHIIINHIFEMNLGSDYYNYFVFIWKFFLCFFVSWTAAWIVNTQYICIKSYYVNLSQVIRMF